MMTSSPSSQMARMALKQDCLAPELTTIWRASYSTPLSVMSLLAIASLSSGMPAAGVYLVLPSFRA